MKEQILPILKKSWFVILVGCIFCSFAIYFAWDTNKDRIPGKSEKGKDIIFLLDDYSYTADEYYESLFNTVSNSSKNGVQQIYLLLEKAIASQLDADSSMKKEIKETAKSMETYYRSLYGNNYEAYMDNQLQLLGYSGADELEDFLLDQTKLDNLVSKHIDETPELVDSIFKEAKPRVISHILISCADPNNPTAEEKAEMEAVEKALKTLSFGEVAKDYSDDTGTVATNGSLGLQLNTANLVEEFKTAAWSLEKGVVSEWVKTTYGYHLIYVEETDQEKIMSNEVYASTIYSEVLNKNTNLKKNIIWEKANDLGITFADDELKAELMAYIGVKETEKGKED